MIGQCERAEAAGNPAQTFSGWMRIGGMRISRAHNLAQQNERWISELVFFQNRIERNVFAVMPKLAIGHVEHDSVTDLFPIRIVREKDELRVLVDEFLDEPRASHAVHFNSLASIAAVLYGAHQIFTRLAAQRIGDGLGSFIVEASAALSILIYLGVLWFSGHWNQKFSASGFNYSLLTGVCVGAGTVAFFLLFQRGGPLSAVPAILAGGAAIMAIAGLLFFGETPSWQRLLGIAFAILGLFLLRR